MLPCVVFADPAGPVFLSAYPQFLDSPLSERETIQLSLIWRFPLALDSSTTAPPGPTGPVTCLAGVVPLPGFQNGTQRFTAEFSFSPRTRLLLPKGEAGITFLLVGSALFVQKSGSRWLNRADFVPCWCCFLYLVLKKPTGAHRAKFDSHRCFGALWVWYSCQITPSL